ncbi:MAG: sigma 54-interacting transcriptional regulator [Candidatus Krumholzibacteria bacterium]|nr:sigma 54-interacting transcriptional regulator [Candidatus Krumholzibacteria bacterium]
MSHDLEIRLAQSEDAFLYLAEMPLLYVSARLLDKTAARVARACRDLPASVRDRAELGLVYARRVHSPDSPEVMLQRVSAIEQRHSDDPVIQREARLVEAVILLVRCGEHARGVSMLENAFDASGSAANGALSALAQRWMGLAYAVIGRHEDAECAYQDALSGLRRFGMDLSYAATLNDYAVLRRKFGHHLQARDLLQDAIRRFDTLGVERNKQLAIVNLGIVAEHLGDWDSAERHYRRAISLLSADDEGQRVTQSTPMRDACLANLEHLQILRRRFAGVEECLSSILGGQVVDRLPSRVRAIVSEYLGEYHMEQGNYDLALLQFDEAEKVCQPTLAGSDVVTEISRRRADLFVRMGRPETAIEIALGNVRLCKRLCDRHELGATERVLGEAYTTVGSFEKARAALRASSRLLGVTHDCYELMRTYIAQAKCDVASCATGMAELALLEARQLAKRLELDYYQALIAIALIDTLGPQERFDEANTWLVEATALRDNLEGIDRDRVEAELKRAAGELQVAMTRASVRSAEVLKTICRVYEDARFPFEDLKPDLAYQVAQSVGAESLFVIGRCGGGYRVPLTYNIAANEAKEIVRQMDRGPRKNTLLGVTGEPKVLQTPKGKTLVAVPCRHEETDRRDPTSYILCTRFEELVTVTPRQLELLGASAEALARLIEDEEERSGKPVGENDEATIRVRHPRGSFKDIQTIDPDMIKVIRMAERAATSVAPILLEGETGVGKELFARAIHGASHRKDGAFVAVNAGGLSVHLVESELFGHVKGSFTGANGDRVGLIETARGGTLFLDEIGEMSEELQVKLLRLLENGEFRRLGESAVRQADVRVISATNRDLKKEVERGTFRRDLFYRVSPIRLTIPPLRLRTRDIQLLVRHFLRDCAALNGIADRYIEIDVKAMEGLELYDWPGNVRELYNEILRVVSLIGRGDLVKFAMLSDNIKEYLKSKNRGDGLLDRSVEQYERRLILNALDKNDWNRMRTADSVGVPRTTLLAKLKRLNVATK